METAAGKHVIRTSDVISFKSCRREWDWSSIARQNWVPDRVSKPLEFGTNWHLAMAIYYDPLTWHMHKSKTMRPVLLDTVKSFFVAANHANMEAQRDSEGELWEEVKEDYKEREHLGIRMLEHYFKWAPSLDNFTPRHVEVEFEVPVLNPDGTQLFMPGPEGEPWPVVYQGKLDGIVEDQFGWYWILEHKTTGAMGSTEHLALDEQTGSYAWAVQHMLGIRTQGVIYSEALKDYPEPPKELLNPQKGRNFSVNKMQRTTYEIVLEHLIKHKEDISNYQDYLEYLKLEENKFFRRMQVHRNLHELEDIGYRIWQESREMLNPNLQIYPTPNRFNCGRCSFRSPCIAKNDGSDYQFLLDASFRHRTDVEISYRRARV